MAPRVLHDGFANMGLSNARFELPCIPSKRQAHKRVRCLCLTYSTTISDSFVHRGHEMSAPLPWLQSVRHRPLPYKHGVQFLVEDGNQVASRLPGVLQTEPHIALADLPDGQIDPPVGDKPVASPPCAQCRYDGEQSQKADNAGYSIPHIRGKKSMHTLILSPSTCGRQPKNARRLYVADCRHGGPVSEPVGHTDAFEADRMAP